MLDLDLTGRLSYGMTVAGLRKLTDYAFRQAGGQGKAVVAISWVDEKTMRHLNWQHRGRRGVTDVLSFAYEEIGDGWPESEDSRSPSTLGEIVVCLPQVKRQAKQIGRTISAEASLMVVHGLLHLMGYDHHTPEQEEEMFGLQQEILFEQKIIYQP